MHCTGCISLRGIQKGESQVLREISVMCGSGDTDRSIVIDRYMHPFAARHRPSIVLGTCS